MKTSKGRKWGIIMKKRIACICLCFVSIFFVACGKKVETTEITDVIKEETISKNQTENVSVSENKIEETKVEKVENKDVTQEEMEALLESESGKEVLYILFDDFDKDNASEAFAILGNLEYAGASFGELSGEIWFASATECRKLQDRNEFKIFDVFDIDGIHFIKTEECYVTESVTRLWNVVDGSAISVDLNNAMAFEVAEDETITVIHNTYDGCSDGSGHTYKHYWLYYQDGFHEYGGVPITQEELLSFQNAKEVLDEIATKGGSVTNILKRENGIININYQIPFDWAEGVYSNEYITLTYTDLAVTKIEQEMGVYLPAYFENIAVYPK